MNISDELINLNFCPICNSNKIFKVVEQKGTMNVESSMKIDLLECKMCKHWFVNPMPSQKLLNLFYTTQSEYVVPKNYVGTYSINEEMDDCYGLAKTIKNGIHYLELGVGNGLLFNKIRQKNIYGLNIGIEPAPWHNDKDIVDHIDKVKMQNFDLAVSFDVLEHLCDPLSMLLKLSNLLKIDGEIYLTFPNKDSLIAQLQKSKWSMFRAFGHLHYFSYKSVLVMLDKCSLNKILVESIRIRNMSTKQSIKFSFRQKNFIKSFECNLNKYY